MDKFTFEWDDRLGISLPALHVTWESFNMEERESILLHWEEIRGRIPNRIKELEAVINIKQELMFEEENFESSCLLNSEIAELASQINDLHLWYRVNQDVSDKVHL